jgi:hypothetical protein
VLADLRSFAIYTPRVQADITLTHNVIGTPVTVEVIDRMNPYNKQRFDLQKSLQRTIRVTGTSAEIRVFEKGTGRLKSTQVLSDQHMR